MVKKLSDVCLDFICNHLDEFKDLHSFLTPNQKSCIIERLGIHDKFFSQETVAIAKKQLFSHILTDLNLQHCEHIDGEFLKQLATCCKGLESLAIIKCYNVTDHGLEAVFCQQKRLKKLTLNHLAAITGSSFSALACPSLQFVNLRQSDSLEDDGLSALVQNCQRISSLDLFSCNKLTDAGLECVAGFLVGRLERLNCSYVNQLTDEPLITLADRCCNLKLLKLHGCTKISPIGLRAVFKACPLLAIDLSYCYALLMNPDILSDSLPSTLTSLVLRGTQVSTFFFECLAERCKNIQTLKLCGLQSLTDDNVCEMLELIGTEITNLDLSWCSALTDVTVRCIMKNCTKLTKLALTYCNGITGVPLKEFTMAGREKQAGRVKKLALQACRLLNIDTILDILPHLPNLEYLGLSGQRSFTDEHMFCIARNCPRLTNLNIKGCVEVTDTGVCEVVRYCPNLDSIVLAGLHLLTDKTIFYMASSIASTLKYLYISGCSKMSSPAVTYLKDVCINYLFVEHKTPNAPPDQLMARNLDTGEFCRADQIQFAVVQSS